MQLLNKLKYWLKPINIIFQDFENYTLDSGDNTKHRIFIDRKSDVLFIAHLDTVVKPQFHYKTRKRIYATGLDDRLGCLVAYELAEQLGTDLLLTDHEESFNSTAKYHSCKNYNWIVEFDRYQDDIVLYECGSKDFENVINEYWRIGLGSFSDISLLDTESCCMNLGIGYYNAHSKNSYAKIKTVYRQIEKFKLFYAKHKDTAFIRDVSFRLWTWADNNDGDYCELCGWNDGTRIYDYCICADCLRAMVNQYLYCEENEYQENL